MAHSIYDLDSSGKLEKYEVEQLTKDVYGETAITERTLRTIETLAPKGNEPKATSISKEEFGNFNQKQPLLLYPAYQMQDTLKQKIMGKRWWGELSDEREKTFKTRSLFEILHGLDPSEVETPPPEPEPKPNTEPTHGAVSMISADVC